MPEVKKEVTGRVWVVKLSYYYQCHDKDGNFNGTTEEEWKKQKIQEIENLKRHYEYVFYIFHNKDIDEDGSIKPLHIHIYFMGKKTTQNHIMTLFNSTRAEDCQRVHNKVSSLLYLLHWSTSALRNKKTKYSVDDLYQVKGDLCNKKEPPSYDFLVSGVGEKSEGKNKKENMEDLINKCISEVLEGIPVSEIRKKYTSDDDEDLFSKYEWYKNVKPLLEKVEEEWLSEEGKKYSSENSLRCLTTIMISGSGEIGKTDLSIELCKNFSDIRGVHVSAAAGSRTTFDFAGNYRGQKVSLLNEFEGEQMGIDQACEILDLKKAPLVNSRNFDKYWFPEYCFITNSRGIIPFIKKLWVNYCKKDHLGYEIFEEEKEKNKKDRVKGYVEAVNRCLVNPELNNKIKQLLRRIVIKLILTEEEGKNYCSIYILNKNIKISDFDTAFRGHTFYKKVEYKKQKENKNLIEEVEKSIYLYYTENDFNIRPLEFNKLTKPDVNEINEFRKNRTIQEEKERIISEEKNKENYNDYNDDEEDDTSIFYTTSDI